MSARGAYLSDKGIIYYEYVSRECGIGIEDLGIFCGDEKLEYDQLLSDLGICDKIMLEVDRLFNVFVNDQNSTSAQITIEDDLTLGGV